MKVTRGGGYDTPEGRTWTLNTSDALRGALIERTVAALEWHFTPRDERSPSAVRFPVPPIVEVDGRTFVDLGDRLVSMREVKIIAVRDMRYTVETYAAELEAGGPTGPASDQDPAAGSPESSAVG